MHICNILMIYSLDNEHVTRYTAVSMIVYIPKTFLTQYNTTDITCEGHVVTSGICVEKFLYFCRHTVNDMALSRFSP